MSRMGRQGPGRAPRAELLAIALLVGACSAGPVDVVGLDPGSLTLGMVAYWPCDEVGEGPLVDRSGNGHDGRLFGPEWIVGHFAAGLHFDAGNWINVPSFPQAGSSWSVALWYRAPAGDYGDDELTLVSNQLWEGGWAMSARLSADARRYRFSFPVGGDASGASVQVETDQVEVDRWVHLAAVLDGERSRLGLFKNGVLVSETNAPAPIQPGTDNLYLGRWNDARRFLVGDLDDIVVFNRALVPAEVQALVAGPAPALR